MICVSSLILPLKARLIVIPMLLEGIEESIYSPQTFQIQFLEEGSTVKCEGTSP